MMESEVRVMWLHDKELGQPLKVGRSKEWTLCKSSKESFVNTLIFNSIRLTILIYRIVRCRLSVALSQ